MRRNILKQRLKAGETAIGSMVQEMTTPTVAQVFKQVGFDFFMIDGEHSPYSLSRPRRRSSASAGCWTCVR